MITLLIIADDFTGALDTGVKFAQKGTSVQVVTDCDYDFAQAKKELQVLVMDTETRHIDEQEAYKKVFGIVKRARKAGVSYIYKKTDSGLRGNIGSELTAVLEAAGDSILHFAPALPKMNRLTKQGIHYIDGVPVSESVFGRDPFDPVLESDISKIIRIQSKASVEIITDRAALTKVEQPTIAVYDTETEGQMEEIAHNLYESEQLTALAGCAGLAEYLPDILNLTGEKPGKPQFDPGLLIACGSINPITMKQLDYGENHGFHRIHLTLDEKLVPGYFETDLGKERITKILDQLKETPFCILDSHDVGEAEETMTRAESMGIASEEVRTRIASSFGSLLKELLKDEIMNTLLITGGDTLMGFLQNIGVNEMTPIYEMEPGVVLSIVQIHGKDYNIISKSGGFGEEDLMEKLADKIMDGVKG